MLHGYVSLRTDDAWLHLKGRRTVPSIFDSMSIRGKKHDVPDYCTCGTRKEERASHLDSIRGVGGKDDSYESDRVRRNSEELGNHVFVTKAGDDGGKEEGV